MRRDDLVKAVNRLLAVFTETKAFDFFKASHDEKVNSSQALSVLRRISDALSRLGPAEREILGIFGLDELEADAAWLEIIVEGQQTRSFQGVSWNLNQFRRYMPPILHLLENDTQRMRPIVDAVEVSSQSIFTTILLEERGQASKPERLIDTLRSVTAMYEAASTILGVDTNSLSVIGCDSGSDKSFDFLGVADAIKALKELVLEIWDRVIFYRNVRYEANLSTAFRSLTLVETISRMQEGQRLGHEEAERLKHQLITGASLFVDCGVIIPEMEQHAGHNPRALLAPQPKLITSGAEPAEGGPDGSPTVGSTIGARRSLTEEEERLLRQLLEKARGDLGGGSR